MIRADLAEDLKHWLDHKFAALQKEALRVASPSLPDYPATSAPLTSLMGW